LTFVNLLQSGHHLFRPLGMGKTLFCNWAEIQL